MILVLFRSCGGRSCEGVNKRGREEGRERIHVPANKKLTGSRVVKGKSVRAGRSHEVWAR